jgi:hypothetical protein
LPETLPTIEGKEMMRVRKSGNLERLGAVEDVIIQSFCIQNLAVEQINQEKV